MRQVIDELQRLRRRSRAMLVAQRLSAVLTWALMGAVLAVGLDYALRLPASFRLVTLIAGLGALTWAVVTYLLPALAFRPSLTQLALRVERLLPNVAGRLASSVEFVAAGVDQSNSLAARSVRDTEGRLAGDSVTVAVRAGRTAADVGFLGLILALILAAVIASPGAASIGVSRLLMPYGAAQWPARTGVTSLMSQVVSAGRGAGVYPRGKALALRAKATKAPEDQRVEAHYRMSVNGAPEAWQRIVLTHQGSAVHERLVDTSLPGAESIEVWFSTADAQSQAETIMLVPPPAVVRATLSVTPPSYAAGRVPELVAELGPGVDARAVSERPSLEGSAVTLRLELNKPLPVPLEDGAPDAAWMAKTLGWTDGAPLPTLAIDAPDASRWTLRWTLAATRRLDLSLLDEYGLANDEPIAYRIDAVEDRLLTVTMTQPTADEIVLPTAQVALAAEARDDVAVSSIGLEAGVQQGGATKDAPAQTSAWKLETPSDAPAASIDATLDLASLKVKQGDVVIVEAVAQDVFDLDGRRHEPQRSPPRRLRVTSELDFATQLRRELSAMRQQAIRIESMQGELQEDVIDDGVQPGVARAQAQIAERLADQQKTVDAVSKRIQDNRLQDESLNSVLSQAGDLLKFAGQAASNAVGAIEAAHDAHKTGDGDSAGSRPSPEATKGSRPRDGKDSAGPQGAAPQSGSAASQPAPGDSGDGPRPPGSPPPSESARKGAPSEQPEARGQPAPEDRQIVEHQQQVRDELADLIELLDRDEDTWVVTRQLDNLQEAQAKLEAETAALDQQTLGRSRSELTPLEGTALDSIKDKQEELADQGRKLIDEMRDRAKGLENVDPQSARGLRMAANTGEQQELPRNMDSAAQQAQDNQLRSAQSSQQQARKTMQQMRQDMDDAKRAKAEELQRRMASLVESIQRLISVQESELAGLASAQLAADYSGRDRGMIRLNQNTQSVAGEARAAGPDARRVARNLDRAADAQGDAVAALRAQPANAALAQNAEEHSLELLKEAKDLAEKLRDESQAEARRQRLEELMAAYRQLAEKQVAVRGQTLELGKAPELDRRQLVDARLLAGSQEQIRTGLLELRTGNQELTEALVFSHVHRLMDQWSKGASEAMEQGRVGAEATDRQQLVADSIGRLIAALEESQGKPKEFADQRPGDDEGGGGEAGGGQQPLIPPITELKLLRGIQEQVYNQTRDLDARTDLEAGDERDRLRDVGQQQRELLDLGQQMLEKLKATRNPAAPPGASAPDQPAPPSPPPPPGPQSQSRAPRDARLSLQECAT